MNKKELKFSIKKHKSDLIFLQDELRVLSRTRDYNNQSFFEDIVKEFMNNTARDSADI